MQKCVCAPAPRLPQGGTLPTPARVRQDQLLSERIQLEGQLRAYQERMDDLEAEHQALLDINEADRKRFNTELAKRDRELREQKEALAKAEVDAATARQRAERAEQRARQLGDEVAALRTSGNVANRSASVRCAATAGSRVCNVML